MHILVTNDDGILAPGLSDLIEALAPHWRVTAVAPETEQSAMSHALTVRTPLRLIPHTDIGSNPACYGVTGTPTDCAKFALSYLLKNDMPDLLVSGVNDGFNLGSDALYSGTVSAAMEGLFYGVPALAVSLERYTEERSAEVLSFLVEFIRDVYEKKRFEGLLNVNFPSKGACSWDNVKVLNQGYQRYEGVIEPRRDPQDNPYYWVAGTLMFDREEEPTDVAEIKNGHITVVALQWKQQDYGKTEEIRNILETR